MTREAGVGIHIAPADVVNVWHVLRCRGGTEVTVTGNNVDAAAQPIITVTVVVTRFNSIDDADDVDAATTSQTTVTSEVLKCDALYQSIAAIPIPVLTLTLMRDCLLFVLFRRNVDSSLTDNTNTPHHIPEVYECFKNSF